MDKSTASPNSISTINAINNNNGNGVSTTISPASFPQPTPRSPSSSSIPTEYSSTSTAVAGSYDFLYELVQKRITTFTYLKQAHEGRVHWFNTVCLSKEDLGMVYENVRMKKRYTNLFIFNFNLIFI